MSIIDNVQDVVFSSKFSIDKILGTYSGTFSALPPGAFPVRSTDVIHTNIPESTFFQGIYSVDSGATWKDFNIFHYVSNSVELQVFGRSNAGTLTITAHNSSFSSPTTFTVMYKVLLIAKPDQGDITPQPIGADIIFDSRLNYQKILVDQKRPISISNNTTWTENFGHGLNYVPSIRSFIETSVDEGGDLGWPSGLYETNYFGKSRFSAGAPTPDGVVESTSEVNLNGKRASVVLGNFGGVGDFSGDLFMRIYYDA